MSAYSNYLKTVNGLLNDAKSRKIINLDIDNVSVNSTFICEGKKLNNFGSCSYLGLEFNQKLIEGSIKATKVYGSQFSSSRAYASLDLYYQYETLLNKIFNANTIITPTTSLGHIAAIPNQVNDNDAVILDHQVHNSVHIAVNMLKSRKIHVELVRHNNMENLEERICTLSKKFDKVWYMTDGIFSMYGDFLNYQKLSLFLDKYSKFHLYVDDAHGMSWAGKNGRGFTLNKMNLHDKMILATSLNKSFASGGGVLVFPSKEQVNLIRNCAAPLVTSGPLQPGNLGAGLAAAKIHLSNEIYKYQDQLMDNIRYTSLLLERSGLPAVFNFNTPIFFVGVSLPKVAYNIIDKMKADGHYVNLGMFPAVPMRNTGIRFTITRLNSFEQIENMITDLVKNYHLAMKEEQFSEGKIFKAFKIKPLDNNFADKVLEKITDQTNLKIDHQKHYKQLNKIEWDRCFDSVGSFNWEGIKLLQDSFTENNKESDNWTFDFITIKDKNNNIVLSTFLTSTLNKDDMLAPGEISRLIEKERKTKPNYLVSKYLFLGSLFTEGNHLYLDRTNKNWKNALSILFDKIDQLKSIYKTPNVILRDFENIDDELKRVFIDNGFYQSEMPQRFEVNNLNWNSTEEFLSQLSKNSKMNIKREVLRKSDSFNLKIFKAVEDNHLLKNKLELWYKLYLNVQQKSFKLNTFPLPLKLFKNICQNENWEVIELSSKDDNRVVAVIFSNINGELYSPMIIGLDYFDPKKILPYKQGLYQSVMRAKKIGSTKISLGFSAEIEKRKVGAVGINCHAFVCNDNTFNQHVIHNGTITTKKEELIK